MIYSFFKVVFKLYFKIFFRIEIKGLENLPENEGFIISANHVSSYDPFVVGCCIKPKIYYMAKSELFSNKFKSFFFKSIGAFPVRRGTADITAIKTAIQTVKDGHVFGIFPEGTRTRENKEIKVQPGVAMIAIKAKGKIVPVGIKSSYKFFSKIYINFGKPIDLSNFYTTKATNEDLEKISKGVMENIIKLL